MEILMLIFPELVNLKIFEKMSENNAKMLKDKDFIFRLCLCIVDDSDNVNYFLYKYNFSNKDKRRIIFLKENLKYLDDKEFFTKNNLLKILYFNDSLLVEDLIDFKIINSNKKLNNLINLKKSISNIDKPIFPLKAQKLMDDYKLKEGEELGVKMKKLENIWIDNNFELTKDEIEKTINS